jgi:hypothetical protein
VRCVFKEIKRALGPKPHTLTGTKRAPSPPEKNVFCIGITKRRTRHFTILNARSQENRKGTVGRPRAKTKKSSQCALCGHTAMGASRLMTALNNKKKGPHIWPSLRQRVISLIFQTHTQIDKTQCNTRDWIKSGNNRPPTGVSRGRPTHAHLLVLFVKGKGIRAVSFYWSSVMALFVVGQ